MKFIWRGLFLLSVVFLFFTCKEDDSILGENFLDTKLSIYYDTVTNYTTRSEPYDANDTILSGASLAVIGDYYDEVFGDTRAMTVFDLAPQSNAIDSAANRTADSLILQLKFRGTYYGYDTTNEQTFNLYAVEQPLNQIDGSVLSNVNLGDYYDPNNPIATTTYRPSTDSVSDFLKFDLPISMADNLMQNLDTLISSDSAFVANFKGFVITAERQGGTPGALVQYDFAAQETHMRLHFSDAEYDNQVFYFHPTSSDGKTSRFNFFEHDYTTGSINSHLVAHDPPQFIPGDSLAYIQAGRGINLKIDIDLSESEIFDEGVNNEDLVINQVRLNLQTIKKFKYLSNDTIEYAPPSGIVVMEYSNGETEPIVDYLIEPGLTAPEYYEENRDNSYDLVFSGLVHEKVVEGDSTLTLWLRPTQPSITANRAVFYGSGAVDSLKPKVFITYSKRTNN